MKSVLHEDASKLIKTLYHLIHLLLHHSDDVEKEVLSFELFTISNLFRESNSDELAIKLIGVLTSDLELMQVICFLFRKSETAVHQLYCGVCKYLPSNEINEEMVGSLKAQLERLGSLSAFDARDLGELGLLALKMKRALMAVSKSHISSCDMYQITEIRRLELQQIIPKEHIEQLGYIEVV